jgi:hypothetical protein
MRCEPHLYFIEGKVAREAMSECGQRASFNISELATCHAEALAEADDRLPAAGKAKTFGVRSLDATYFAFQALATPSARPPPPKYSLAFSAVVDSRSEQCPVAPGGSPGVSEANEWRPALHPHMASSYRTLSTRGY